MKRIVKKEIKAKILSTASKKVINSTHHNEPNYFKRFNPLGENGKSGFDRMFKGMNYTEAADLLKRAFEDAADREGVSYDAVGLRISKPKAYGDAGVDICLFREETDEEFDERIEKETDKKVNLLRDKKKDQRRHKAALMKQKKELEEQLKNLE